MMVRNIHAWNVSLRQHQLPHLKYIYKQNTKKEIGGAAQMRMSQNTKHKIHNTKYNERSWKHCTGEGYLVNHTANKDSTKPQ